MKLRILKYLLLLLIIVNGLTLYMFYDYITDRLTMFHGLGVFCKFVSLLLYSFFLAFVLLLVRLYFLLKRKRIV